MKRIIYLIALLTFLWPTISFAQSVDIVGPREDDTAADRDRGIPALARRCDTATQTASADGKYGLFCTDSSGRLWITGTFAGGKTSNAAVPGADNFGAMGDVACSSVQTLTAGRLAFPCSDVHGSRWVTLRKEDGSAVTYLASLTEAATEAAAGTLQPTSSYTKAYDGTTFSRVRGRSGLIGSGDFGFVVRPFMPSDGTNTVAIDPCQSETKTTDAFSITADTVIITATASKKNFICSFIVVAGAAEIVSITEGTGSTCGTSEAALLGSTTDANGASLAPNGGFPYGNGSAAVISGKTANVDTCLNVSGTNRVSGSFSWVQR